MSTFLVDGNVLIALIVTDHVHHDVAIGWFERDEPELATCPITEATLLRFLLREGRPAVEAIAALDAIRLQDWHLFWPDALAYDSAQLAGVLGHRQVIDAYLVALARHNAAKVASFDKGLAALHPDHVHPLGR